MKSRTFTYIVAVAALATLAIPLCLAAQDPQEHHAKKISYMVKDLGTFGGTQGVAEGISNRGWVVGDANLTGNQSVRAFLWLDGVKTDLGTLGGVNSEEQWPVKVQQRWF